MSTEKKNTEELVDIHIERGSSNDDPNLMVGINGKNYLLPKGKTSKVPKAVYNEIMRSKKAQTKADENIDSIKEAQKPK